MTPIQHDKLAVPIRLSSIDPALSPRDQACLLVADAAAFAQSHLIIILECPEILTHYQADDRVRIWKPLQALLGDIYVAASNTAYKMDKPLLDIEVIINETCGYDAWMEGNEPILCLDTDVDFVRLVNRKRRSMGLEDRVTIPHVLASTGIQNHTMASNTGEDGGGGIQVRNPPAKKKYDFVALGGTFDHLHVGHKILLSTAVWVTSKRLICGITDTALLKNKKHAEQLESLDTRMENVRAFLRRMDRSIALDILPIYDPYGPTITDKELQLIVGSAETLKGCEAINTERKKVNLKEIDILIIDVISPENTQVGSENMSLKISSTHIRAYLSKNPSSSV